MALPCPAARSVLEILEIHQESSFDRISFQIEGVDGPVFAYFYQRSTQGRSKCDNDCWDNGKAASGGGLPTS